MLKYGCRAVQHYRWCCSGGAVFVLLHFFTWISLQPPLQSWPDYIIRKEIRQRIQRYTVHTEILPIFHTRVNYRSIRYFCIVFTSKLPLLLRQSPPKCNTPFPSPISLTTPKASGSIHPCRHCSHVRTDRWDKQKFYPISASLYERRANNMLVKFIPYSLDTLVQLINIIDFHLIHLLLK